MANRKQLVTQSIDALTKLRDEYEKEARKSRPVSYYAKTDSPTHPQTAIIACNAALIVLVSIESEDKRI